MDCTWDLSVLYRDFQDAQIEKDFETLEGLMAAEEAALKEPKVGDAAFLEERMARQEEISALTEKLGNFAQLTLAADASNEAAQQMDDRLNMLYVKLQLIHSAMVRLVGKTQNLDEMMLRSKALNEVRFCLERMRDEAGHLMDEAAEKWVRRLSLSGGQAFSNLRDKLDATLTVDYRGQQLPLSAVRSMAYDPDETVRKDAYEAEIASYAKIEIPMAAALNGVKGESITLAEATHYPSVLYVSLDQSNMDRATLEAMLQAMKEAMPAFRKYLRKKAQLLGHANGLPFYDLFAPIARPGFKPRTYTIEEARETLVREMSKFQPAMGRFIDRAFENRWIDVYPREGKGGGAFCADLHSLEQSRVLTNFTGSFSDVSTIAHELGHAWHNECMKGLPFALCGAPMPLAETASIFNETMLAHVVRESATPDELFTYIEGDLMECTQVIVDIYSRYLFESAVIEGRKTHTLSVNELKSLMLKAQDDSYGDGLDPEVRHPYMWACKSHYYSPGLAFYNFPYAFGQLFGKGVFAQYLEKGEAFVPTYNQLLRSCGSGMVADVAASVGIDVRSVDFWRKSLKVITDEIDQFIALADA